MGSSVDVVIPIYKAGNDFASMLEKLYKQSKRPEHIYLLQTIEKKDEKLFDIKKCSKELADIISVHPIKKADFDHGATRAYGALMAESDYVLFMTQDAVCYNEYVIENLLKAFDDRKVGIAYARQLAREDADEIERMTRETNYPSESVVKTKKDEQRLGIKTYFCSDVCAMYRIDVYKKLGGFVKKTIFNEDMIMAYKEMQAGFSVAYCADAKVIHSHSYTCKQQFVRSFDLGVSQRQYHEIFDKISSEKEGAGYAKKVIMYLMKKGKFIKTIYFMMQCGFRLIGYKLGKNYDKLPRKMVLACTMNREYWK